MKTKLKCTFEFDLEVTKSIKSKKPNEKPNRLMFGIAKWFISICAEMLVVFLMNQIMNWLFYLKLTIQSNSFLLGNI